MVSYNALNTIIETISPYALQRIRQYDRLQFRQISKNIMSKRSKRSEVSQPKDYIRKRNGFNIPTAITTAPKLPYYIKTVGLRIFHSRRYNYVFHVVIHRHNGNTCRAVKTATFVLYPFPQDVKRLDKKYIYTQCRKK